MDAQRVVETRRWYVRCEDCLAVGAVDVSRGAGLAPERPATGTCPCGGPIEVMGMVGSAGRRLVRQRVESVCDASCTHARGPVCECVCGGRNHGSRRVILVTTDAGAIPRYELAASPERATAFRAALGAAELRVRALDTGDLLRRRSEGEWLNPADYARLMKQRNAWRALEDARRRRTHEGRLKALAAIGG